MLTSFFGKSKPLNFLGLGIYIFLILGASLLLDSETTFTLSQSAIYLGVLLLLVFSLLLLNFIIRKNALTLLNSLAIMVFACMAVMLHNLVNTPTIVLANVFLLFAYRRMYSLQTTRNIEIKILDASLWIALAASFYFWSGLLFIPLYASITLLPFRKMRYYLIPIVGIGIVFLIATAFHFVMDGSFDWFANWWEGFSFDYSHYANPTFLVFITFVAAMLVWTIISKFSSLASGPKKQRPHHILGLHLLAVSLIVVLVAPVKTGSEFLFLLPSAAIIIAGYMEKKGEFWFKEILLWVFVLLPVLFLFI